MNKFLTVELSENTKSLSKKRQCHGLSMIYSEISGSCFQNKSVFLQSREVTYRINIPTHSSKTFSKHLCPNGLYKGDISLCQRGSVCSVSLQYTVKLEKGDYVLKLQVGDTPSYITLRPNWLRTLCNVI